MADILPLQVDELKDAIQLADDTFRDDEQISMGAGFPNVFSESLIGHSHGAFVDQQLVSFLGLVPSVIHIGEARLNIFSLGAVCTHPDHRGQGYASAILDQQLRHIDQAQASLLLVSGGRSLYTRVGCSPFGAVTRYTVDSGVAQHLLESRSKAKMTIREWQPADLLGLAEVAASRTVRYEQSTWDLALLIRAEALASCMKLHHKVLVAEQDGRISAFTVVGVPYTGQNRQPVTFEWAGDPDIVTALLASAVQRYDLKSLDIPVPWHERGLLDTLSACRTKQEKNVGTVKITDPERLIAQLRPYLRAKNRTRGDALSVRALREGQTEVRLGGHSATLDSAEMVSLILDPEPTVKVSGPLQQALADLFPIPFPFTGGLNYV